MSTTTFPCCVTHDGPHVHGCCRERIEGFTHRGQCLTDPSDAAAADARERSRVAAMPDPPRVAWIKVELVDDCPKSHLSPYPRPDVLELSAAVDTLKRLDLEGGLEGLGFEVASHVRVLAAAVGRMSASDLAEAFPPQRVSEA